MIRGERGGRTKKNERWGEGETEREVQCMTQVVEKEGCRYPDGFRHIFGVLERLENWGTTTL